VGGEHGVLIQPDGRAATFHFASSRSEDRREAQKRHARDHLGGVQAGMGGAWIDGAEGCNHEVRHETALTQRRMKMSAIGPAPSPGWERAGVRGI